MLLRRRIAALGIIALLLSMVLPDVSVAAPKERLHGGVLEATGGNVTVTIGNWNGDAVFTDTLFLSSPQSIEIATFANGPYSGPNLPFVKNLGSFARNTELVFELKVSSTDPWFTRDFFTGPGSRNPDGLIHAYLVPIDNSSVEVHFEDFMCYMPCQNDYEFGEPVFIVSGVRVRDRRIIPLNGRMTGGGSVFTAEPSQPGNTIRVTHGFELHCNSVDLPTNLEINWDGGNRFHLDIVTEAGCYYDASVGPALPPAAPFNVAWGAGSGSLNGVPGASVYWALADGGEPGTSDRAWLRVRDPLGNMVIDVRGAYLTNGNQQARMN